MISNISKARLKSTNDPMSPGDIAIGVEITMPSPAGGRLPYKCVAIDDCSATFECTNKEWPQSVDFKFSQCDFTHADFEHLAAAMKRLSTYGLRELPGDRDIVRRADQLGYAVAMSYTQFSWTDLGIETFQRLKSGTAA